MRRLSLFALIFIVLAGLYWLLEGPGGKKSDREPHYLLRGFEPAHVERINISNSNSGTIVLQRADGGWQVTTEEKTFYAADSSAVQALLDSMAALKTNSIVSRNPDRHALYEVSPETGLHVKALNQEKQPLADLLIGKSGPNIFSTYVRAANSDAVYLVDGIMQNAAAKTRNEWRNKTIFSFNPDLVRNYAVSDDRDLALHKRDAEWQTGTDNATVDAGTIDRIVRAFASLSAADFAEGPLEDFGLAAPTRTITVALADNESVTLLFGKDANAFQQYAKTADADTIYIIEKHVLGMLCPTMEELKTPAPEEDSPTDPAETQPVK